MIDAIDFGFLSPLIFIIFIISFFTQIFSFTFRH